MSQREQVVVVGAGPYGLSIGAHLNALGARFRIFGTPMHTWRKQMPEGMLLKSDGFASNLSDPNGELTLERYCQQHGIAYDHTRIPVPLDTFISYGIEFQQRFVPQLEDHQVAEVETEDGGFRVTLDNGEVVHSEKVVLAVGITHFQNFPDSLAELPPDLAVHSSSIYDLKPLRGRDVTVLGAGASGLDLSALLHEGGAKVTLLARTTKLLFHDAPPAKPRSALSKLRHPPSGIGPGWRSRFYTDAPLLFHLLPQDLRLKIVKTHLHPAAGWPMRERVVGKVPTLLGYTIEKATAQDGGVRLDLVSQDGSRKAHWTEQVIASTGYKVDLRKLSFLGGEMLAQIESVEHTPILTTDFQSSVPGLYFVGVTAANSFGPVLRFAFGAEFAANHLAKVLKRTLSLKGSQKPQMAGAASR
jgi:thioredoxin reductase